MSAGIARLEIEAHLDRRNAEALLLEIRLLGRRYGIELGEARVEMPVPEAGEDPGSV